MNNIVKPNAANLIGIHDLIKGFSDEKLMLPLTLEEICHRIHGFRIIIDKSNKVIASAYLDIFTPEIAEIKSLAVAKNYQRQGLGAKLVTDCEKEAKELGIKKVFVLTYQEKFFADNDYRIVDRNTLPEKVYRECVVCPFYHNCNETAMIKEI